jgi:hypothetical protein
MYTFTDNVAECTTQRKGLEGEHRGTYVRCDVLMLVLEVFYLVGCDVLILVLEVFYLVGCDNV